MPIYEFICQNCGEINEKLMKISDPHPTDCNSCDQGQLVKKVSQSAFVLKGEGWYETDFKTKPTTQKKNVNSDTSTNSTNEKTTSNEAAATPPPAKASETAAAPSAKVD